MVIPILWFNASFSGDRQMNTEMNYSRKLELVICIAIYMFLNGICCGQYQRVVFKLDQNPIFLSHLAIPKFKCLRILLLSHG